MRLDLPILDITRRLLHLSTRLYHLYYQQIHQQFIDMAESIAPTTELSSRDDLTELHVQSDLPADFHVPRTFKLSSTLSRRFMFMLPTNRQHQSNI